MTPTSFYVSKFKVLNEDSGMVDTGFYGNQPLATPTLEIEFSEVILEDLSPEQVAQVKVGSTLSLNFDNHTLMIPPKKRKHEDEDDREMPLSSDEPVIADVLEIIDNTQAADGVIKVKISASYEFKFPYG